MITMMIMIQKLAQCHKYMGKALVPYYRQILPTFNLYKTKKLHLGDGMSYGRYKTNLGELVEETLDVLVDTGGEVNL